MYTVQLYRYRKRYSESQHKQTTQIHTMHLQYLKIGTPPAQDAPQWSTSDAPNTQHHPNHTPCLQYGGNCTPLCTVLCRAHRTLSTIQHNTSPPYSIHGTSCAAHTVPAFFKDMKIMRIKAQEKMSNSSGIEFFLHK
jgi:hypothetical protein